MCDQCPLDPPEIPSPEAALAVLDTSLLIARVQAKCSLMEARRWWYDVGQYAMGWHLKAALEPNWTEREALDVGHYLIQGRTTYDWTPEQVAEIVVGLFGGYAQRVVLTAPR